MTATRARGQAVYDKLHSEEARGFLKAILDGDLDDDLAILIVNAKRRQSHSLRRTYRIGQRVKLVGTRNATVEGKVGEVAKVNPSRVVVFLDDDWREWMGPRERLTAREKADYGSFSVPPSMLEVEGAGR